MAEYVELKLPEQVMICPRCGGQLDPDLSCPYCDTKYKNVMGDGNVVDAIPGLIDNVRVEMTLPWHEEMMLRHKGLGDDGINWTVMSRLAEKLARSILPYMEVVETRNNLAMEIQVVGRIRVVKKGADLSEIGGSRSL